MPVFVIVGAMLAGAKAAETLRSESFDGDIMLLGSEHELPYQRPPLSKGYLLGKEELSSLLGKEELSSAYVHPADWYPADNVELRSGVTVTSIDRAARTVTADGQTLGYDKLLLATGASPRRLDVPGADLDGVLYLRTIPDSTRLRSAFQPEVRVVTVGAGWIGLETAAAARLAGCQVTVVDPQPGALYGALGPELGGMFADLHRAHGVEFRFGETVTELRAADGGAGTAPSGRVDSAVTSGGAELPADVVLSAIGVLPNTGLAAQAGLEVSNGVLADAALRTSDPDIFTVGDVANWFNPLLGRRIRVEHWANALNGGPAAARSMLGQPVGYDSVPYFFTDQYDLSMECAGLPEPGRYDQVVYRGDRDAREFIAFWLSGGRIIAGMNVNVWDVTDDIQALIRSGRVVDVARLTDPSIPIAEV